MIDANPIASDLPAESTKPAANSPAKLSSWAAAWEIFLRICVILLGIILGLFAATTIAEIAGWSLLC